MIFNTTTRLEYHTAGRCGDLVRVYEVGFRFTGNVAGDVSFSVVLDSGPGGARWERIAVPGRDPRAADHPPCPVHPMDPPNYWLPPNVLKSTNISTAIVHQISRSKICRPSGPRIMRHATKPLNYVEEIKQ
ncbi:MAG: hypothetical protein CL912_30125 [Deltaproteobacteria bacterium]|nr:hypothetical protein [Deltaproteobacteria bacterium]